MDVNPSPTCLIGVLLHARERSRPGDACHSSAAVTFARDAAFMRAPIERPESVPKRRFGTSSLIEDARSERPFR